MLSPPHSASATIWPTDSPTTSQPEPSGAGRHAGSYGVGATRWPTPPAGTGAYEACIATIAQPVTSPETSAAQGRADGSFAGRQGADVRAGVAGLVAAVAGLCAAPGTASAQE